MNISTPRPIQILSTLLAALLLCLVPLRSYSQGGKILGVQLKLIGPDGSELTETHYAYNFTVELLGQSNARIVWNYSPPDNGEFFPEDIAYLPANQKVVENTILNKTYSGTSDTEGLQIRYIDNTLSALPAGLLADRLTASRGGESLCYVKKVDYNITGGSTLSGTCFDYNSSGNWYDHPARTSQINDLQDDFLGPDFITLNDNMSKHDFSVGLKDVSGDINVLFTVYLAEKNQLNFDIVDLTGCEIYLYNWNTGGYLKSSFGTEGYTTRDVSKINNDAKLKLSTSYSVWENTVILIQKKGEAVDGVTVDGYKGTALESLIGEVKHPPSVGTYWAVIAGPDMQTIRPGDGSPPPPTQHKITYVKNGTGYSDLSVKQGSTDISSGGSVQDGQSITIEVTPDDCQKVTGILVKETGRTKELTSSPFTHTVTREILSITPILKTKETTITWTVENVNISVNNGAVTNNGKVNCGSTLEVAITPTNDCQTFSGDLTLKIDGVVQNPAPVGVLNEKTYSYEIDVAGESMTLEAQAITKQFNVVWTSNSNYTLSVDGQTSGSITADCGSNLTIEATSEDSERPVQSITVTFEDNSSESLTLSNGSVANSKKGVISNLSQGITAITVQLAPPPNTETIVYNNSGTGYKLKVFDKNNAPLPSNSQLVLNTPITIEVTLADECYSLTGGTLTVFYKDGTNEPFTINGSLKYEATFPPRQSITSIEVTLPQKSYKVSSDSPALTLTSASGASLNAIPCGSMITVAVDIPECQEINRFIVNDLPNDNFTLAADGKSYEFEVKENSRITISFKNKELNINWNTSSEYRTTVKSGSTTINSGDQLTCGSPLTIEVKSSDTDRSVQSITVKYSTGASDVFTADDFTTLNSEGSHVRLNIPKINNSITAITADLNAAPQKYTVTYVEDGDEHQVEVKYFNSGEKIESGSPVREQTKLGVQVTLTNAQRDEVKWVKVNDENITANYDAVAGLYPFIITDNSTITVELQPRKYHVEYTQPSDCQLEVRIGSPTGKEIAAGAKQPVRYETEIYVRANVNANEGVFVEKYLYNGTVEITEREDDGWYKFTVTEDVTSITVQLHTLGTDESLVNYTRQYKDTVWKRVGNDFEVQEVVIANVSVEYAGRILEEKNEIVPRNAELKITITVTDPSKFQFACLTVQNRIVSISIGSDGTYTLRIEKLEESLQKFITLDAWITRKVTATESSNLFHLIVQEPQNGDLHVRRPGMRALKYNQTYHAAPHWKYEVSFEPKDGYTIKNSCSDLVEHLDETSPFNFQIDEAREEKRVNLWVVYAPRIAGYNVRYSATEGGSLTATNLNGDAIPESSIQQKWVKLQFTAQADEGFYLERLEFNGTNVLQATGGEADQNLLGFTYTQDVLEELTVHAIFKKIPEKPKDTDHETPVESNLLAGVSLSPNPAHEQIRIQHANNVREYKIFDLNGRLLQSGYHQSGNELHITLYDLSSGFYIIRLHADNAAERALKFIKQ